MSASKPTKRKHSVESTVPRVSEVKDDADDLQWSDDEGTTVEGIYIPAPIKRHVIKTSNTRLVISKITNNFFKSYAEWVTLGPFSKCFNCIVGPNGSGKSNVIDSILFVFGYRSTRIRCKKLSVLLHNSEMHQNVQNCTVAVHFCEIIDKAGDDYQVVPNSEFVVSRTAHKDSSSFYELNGRRVQFKEIAKLLKHHGIDLDHNRFLILQGEVEEIAMMKSKGANENETGMLEYLEDIIGTSRYKKPLEQLNDKVEVLSNIRTEKLNRISLIEKELAELRAPMEQAVSFLKTENKIATFKNFLYQKNMHELDLQIKEIEEDKAKIEESRDNIIDNLKKVVDEKDQKENTLKEETGKHDNLQRKKDQLKEAFNAAEKKDVQLQAEMVQVNKDRKKFKQQLGEEKQKLEDLKTIPEKNQAHIAEYEGKQQELTQKLATLQEEKTKLLANIRSETADLQIEKEKLEQQLEKLEKVVDETRSAYNLAESDLKLAQSEEENERNKLEKLRQTLATSEETINKRTDEVAQLTRKIPPTTKSLNDALKELDDVKRQSHQVSEEIRRNRIHLEETRASMQMSRSRGKVLDALTQQKREGKCPGLYGRLGDLGGIDVKYDVAISTACGPLDNIVVDTVDTAQWCIEFLKQHGIGRATFIALDKQEYLRNAATKRIQTPENVHRLYDLIKVQDEAVRTAFYYALRDTLVADDLEQASRIAYGATRYRVVTLKGELIEISGTMSGGGKTVSRGRMGQTATTTTVNPREIETMEVNLEQYERRLKELNQQQATLENQISTLQPELNHMKMNLEKFTRELESAKNTNPIIKEQIKKQEQVVKSTKSNAEQVKKLMAVVKAKKVKFDDASAAAQEVRVEVDKVTDELNEKTVGKMKSVDKNMSEVSKTLGKVETDIRKLRVAITTSERNAKSSAKKITMLEQSIVDRENKLRDLSGERETIESDAKKLLTCIEEIEEQLQSRDSEHGNLKSEIKALIAEEKKLRLKQVDIDETYKNIKAKLSESQALNHQWSAKLSQLKLHNMPEDDTELTKFSLEELESRNVEVVELELKAAQDSIKDVRPNLNVIEEYRQGQNVFGEKAKELEAITKRRSEMKTLYDQVKDQRRDEFLTGYNIIRLKLKEMYQMITLGGDADFEILDSCDPFADGVQLNVRPPRKSWKLISNLSGGEKTLSSLALVFALHYYKPSPLYVMDEIDAALDFKNVSIIGNYIKERTKDTQFIIISLRDNMFELCDNLVGIYKLWNCTRTITIQPKEFDQKDTEQNRENANPNVPENQEPREQVIQEPMDVA